MGKPRMILLIRHAQSEGNKNREIHQVIPDHRVKLTEHGWTQAEDAGRRLRGLLRPDDTLQFFTSPYRRTRETTEGILRTLTSQAEDGAPSPFSRNSIKVYEEPRIREQDFGNFQPCSSEMERMWRERADYGHFFYRIPNGESAADAYDRIAGFNESLWRQFGEADFPSVCVLVTHGLMSRVFLMKWYHWSVEYFEDLRNVNHCEFVVMEKNPDNGKYVLQSQLRTWSALEKQRADEAVAEAEAAKSNDQVASKPKDPQRRNTLSQFLPNQPDDSASPPLPTKWGGCVGGCNHHHERYPRRVERTEAPEVAVSETSSQHEQAPDSNPKEHADSDLASLAQPDGTADIITPAPTVLHISSRPSSSIPAFLLSGRDAGGTEELSTPTPHEEMSEGGDYFDAGHRAAPRARGTPLTARRPPQRKATHEDIERWVNESGMGKGVKADALGDEPSDVDEADAEVSSQVELAKAGRSSVREDVY